MIEVNQASPAVLYSLVGVGGVQQDDIDKLLAARAQQQTLPGQLAWVADALGPARAQVLGNYIWDRCYQYSADIHAFSGDGRAFKRVRIIIDASPILAGNPPLVLYRRDLTTDHPDPMDMQMMTLLRSGQKPSAFGESALGGGIQQ